MANLLKECQQDEATLVSKRILDFKPYFDHKENHDYRGAWFDSYLELWLHKEFMFKAFNRYDFDYLKDINIEYQEVNINSKGILSANWGNQALGVRPMIKVSLS